MAKITLKAGENFANSGCRLIYHQPTVPEKLKRSRKNNKKNMKERIMFMSVLKKRMMVLIAALVFTIAGTVMVFAAEILYSPVKSEVSERFTQMYEMSTTNGWRYTTNIPNLVGDGGIYDEFCLRKIYYDRDGIIQCNSNGITNFPTYYQANLAYTSVYPVSCETELTGIGVALMNYEYADYSSYRLCLGIRNDPRNTSSSSNSGCWSPDTN